MKDRIMDERFNGWAKEFDNSFRDSEAYKNMISKGYDQNAKDLLGRYFQFKQEQSHEKLVSWTKWLVFGTWALVIATLLIVVLKG